MARMSHWLGLSLLSFSLVGCVSQEKYNAMKLDRDQLANRLGQAESELQSTQAQSDAYKAQLAAILNGAGNKDAMVTNLTQQLATLQGQYDALNRQYEDLLAHPMAGGPLPAELNNALKDFAAANPDIVSYDESRGIVKFKSDITFAVGKDELTSRATEVISRFSSILNSQAASAYELQVAGHTDNQRVVNPATIRAGHKDNWYLSAHRAISVAEALQKNGITPNRMGVVGYADQHPVADNSSAAGQAANRRVEVLILPTTVHAPTIASRQHTNTQRRTSPHRQSRPEMNKDTVGVDAAPFNK